MTKQKETIIEFAKELYLTPDEEGNHKYSLRDICTKIAQDLHKEVAFRTIAGWAHRYSWDKVWENGVRAGVIKEIKGNGNQDEKISEAISKRKQESAELNSKLKLKAANILLESRINVAEAVRLYDITTKKEGMDLGIITPEGFTINIMVNSEEGKDITEKIIKGEGT